MPIFDVVRGIPTINPEALTVPEIRKIWDSDPSFDKELGTRKVIYLYHLLDPRSAYAKVGEDVREKLVNQDHLKGFKLDKEMKDAINKVKTLERSVPHRFLDGVEAQLIRMADFLKQAETTESNIAKIALVISKGAELISSHQQLSEKVAQQAAMGNKIKRDVTPNMFDDDYK